jgi:hypothetical protein
VGGELIRVNREDMSRELQGVVDRVEVGWPGLMRIVDEQVADTGDRELAFQPHEVHQQLVELLGAPGACEMETEALEQVAIVGTLRPCGRVALAVAAEDAHLVRELEAVSIEEPTVGEREALATATELMSDDVVLEVVERDPPSVIALGQGPVSEPGEQAPGVAGTEAR